METRSNYDLKQRTKSFALRIIKLYSSLPKTSVAQIIGKQIVRSGTSVGAQYREASRARSKAEFVSKITSLLQELDETVYWLELLVESNIMTLQKLSMLNKEADELVAIFAASRRTAKKK